MKKLVSLLIAVVLMMGCFALSAVAFADDPRVTVNEAKFAEYVVNGVNKNLHVEMNKDFTLDHEWTKDSAKVAEIFPGINYKVTGDEGYVATEHYDVIKWEYCASGNAFNGDQVRLALSDDFNLTAGQWSFRYVVVAHGATSSDEPLAVTSSFTRYAIDTTHPVISLSTVQTDKVTAGLTAGVAYTPSTSLNIKDASSTTVTYVINVIDANGTSTLVYSSKDKKVTEGYENVISTAGAITPSAQDIGNVKYQIVYSVVDAYGYYGIADEKMTDEAHPTMLLSVVANKQTEEHQEKIATWKLVLYVIAGACLVGIVVLLFIKPKQQVVANVIDGKVFYDQDEKQD